MEKKNKGLDILDMCGKKAAVNTFKVNKIGNE